MKPSVFLPVCAFLLSLSPAGAGQAPRERALGAVSGELRDENGKLVPFLQLILVHTETENRIVLSTDQQGAFRVELEAGEYRLYAGEVELRSFLTQIIISYREEIHLELQLGGQKEGLEKGRSPVSPPLDRADPTLAAVAEYRVQGTQLGPVESSKLGELVNPFPARRRGRFHGSVYEFHRNDNFDARNFFDPLGEPLPEYKRNEFGLSVGAELDAATYVLGTYEGLRVIQGSTLLSHVPTPGMKAGDFSSLKKALQDPLTGLTLAGNVIVPQRVHPVARRLLALLPDPNRDDPDRNFVNNQPIVRNQNLFSARLDRELSERAKLYVSYRINESERILVHPLPSFGMEGRELHQSGQIGYNWNVNTGLLADFRMRASRSVEETLSRNAGQEGLVRSLGISGISASDASEEGYPYFSLSGYTSFGDRASPMTSIFNGWSFENSFTYARDQHTLRFGGEFNLRQFNNYRVGGFHRGQFVFSGYYTGDAFADLLFGLPDTASRGIGAERSDLRGLSWQLFLRESWRINPRLRWTLGLSYNYFSPLRSVHDNVSVFYPLLFEPPLEGEIIHIGTPAAQALGLNRAGQGGMVIPDRNDWAPSLSLAYSPLGNNLIVVRGSYSIYYSPLSAGYYLRYLGRNYPFYYTQSAHSSVETPELDLANPFQALGTSGAPAELNIRGLEPGLRTAYVQRWRLDLQSEVLRHWSFEAGYAGSKGTRMPRLLVANVPLPGPGPIQPRRPHPDFGLFNIVTGSGSFTDHSLDLEAERRLAGGFSLKSGFSWSRVLDDHFRGAPSNPRHLQAERGPADFLAPRRFFLNYILELPLRKLPGLERSGTPWVQWLLDGWQLSGITRVGEGRPFTVTMKGDPNNDGVAGDRPDRLGAGLLGASERSIDRWFATADFAAPGDYGFGDSGRNILIGPHYRNWDLSVVKRARLADGDSLEFRVEFFNAFNQVNFDEPSAALGTSLFGKIFGADRAREIEIALKYSF